MFGAVMMSVRTATGTRPFSWSRHPDRGFTGPISWEMCAEVAASITGRRSTVPPVADRVR
jgi:hypothetical protein